MTKLRRLFTLSSLAAVLACSAEKISIGNDLAPSRGAGGAPVETPNSDPVSTFEGYGFCSQNLDNPFCITNWTNDISTPAMLMGFDLEACYCPRDCEEDSDCPVPDTGTSRPVCDRVLNARMCMLPCDDGEACPDGMACRIEVESGTSMCAWYDPSQDQIRGNPAACAERTNQDDCEAVLADYPVPPDYWCAWVRETIISRDDLACEAPIEKERCVAVTTNGAPGFGCGAGACDGVSPKPIQWRETAGDISLLELTACNQYPWGVGNPSYGACSFGSEPASPSVCDCACPE